LLSGLFFPNKDNRLQSKWKEKRHMKNRPLIVVLLIVLAAISMATAVYAKSTACIPAQ